MTLATKTLATKTRRRESGAVLLIALCLLIVILLLGAAAAQLALQGERTARGERDRQMAFQAAEEALMDAENDIEGGPAAPGRSATFAPDSAQGFVSGCGTGADLGLCLGAGEGEPPVWQSVDLADAAPETARSVPYGAFTGAAMPTGEGLLPFRRPRYIIELLPFAQEGEAAADAAPRFLYRVTAIGFGARDGTQVVLQSIYRKRPQGGDK